MKKLLWTEQICYSYEEGVPVLGHVSTTFYTGEKVTVIGSNSSGKSTLFLNLNGALTPDGDTIWHKDKEIGKKGENLLRQHVGLVFQDVDQQIIAPTVAAEVSLGPMNLKLDKSEVRRRTEHAMEAMDLIELAERAPYNLSGGQKRRVSIADIMAMEPRLILSDEPTIALDPQNQQMLEQVLEGLTEMGKALVISIHDVGLAYQFADRILMFDEGWVIADDVPENIFLREDVSIRANLRLPMMMKITDFLKEKGIVESDFAPQTPRELKAMLQFGRRR